MARRSAGLWIAVLAVTLACGTGLAGAAQFQDIAPILNLPGAIGAAWGDYDDDGLPDLVLTSVPSGHWPMLLHNDGDLAFTDVSADAGFPAAADEQDGVAWADYDNDGNLDFVVACGSGTVRLYRNDGEGVLSEVAASAGLAAANGPGRGVAWGDYDADGWLDVFICNTLTNASYLMHSNGDGTFTGANDVAGLTGLAAPTAGNAAAWADYDNDGDADLMLSRMGARPMLFRSNGDGTFDEVGLSAGLSGVTDTFGVAWADYDNDGWLDCYLGSATGVRDQLLHNNGDGTFTDVGATAGMGADASVAVGVAWADYDNDGYVDLYVGNLETDNQPFLYHNRGDGTFAEVAAATGAAGSRPNEAATWADVDRDGRLDLFQAVGGPTSCLLHNLGPAGSWLRVRALTSGSGDATGAGPVRDAIGARIEVNLDNQDTFPSGRTLTRLIDGGSGFCAQNEQVAHFGLGTSGLVAVRVRFPDGSAVVHRNVPANQQIVIRDVPADRVEIFDDVPLDYWAYPSIAAALEAGIVQGYWDDTYRPAGQVDRASMAVYLARALAGGDGAVPDPSGDTPSFSDVGTDHWAYKYIEYAASPEANVVQGYPGGNYKPDDLVNRGQMAVYIARAMVTPSGDAGVPDPPAGDPTFPDVTAENDWSWCHQHVEYLAAEEIVQGYPDGTYHPATIVTRDQMAVYIQRAFDLPL